jgi:ADP-heptose:LPS heptosyltransferase
MKRQKILVYVGEDLLGDAILKLPFIYGLRHAFPAAHIVWWAGYRKSMFARLLNPLVEGCLDEVRETPLERKNLPSEHFDLIIDTQRDLKPTLLLRKIPHDKFLSRTWNYFFSDFKGSRKAPSHHISEQLLHLLSAVVPVDPLTDFSVKLDKKYTDSVKKLFPSSQIYVGLLIGAGQPERRWPLENFIQVAQKQIEKNRVPVFILGPQEADWWGTLREKVPKALFPLQEHPELRESPLYTTAMGNFMACTVASDSGGGHLLGLSKTPLISLFARDSYEKVKPLSKNLTILFEGKKMADLPVEKVLEAVEQNFIKTRNTVST